MQSAESHSFNRLRTSFHLGAILFFLALAIAMQYLLHQYAQARVQTYLAGFRVNAELKTKQIDLRFRLLTDHVLRMQKLAEEAFAKPSLPTPPALVSVSRHDQIVGYEIAAPADRRGAGNFFAHQTFTDATALREYQIALELFPLMAIQHQLDDALRWSGFASFRTGNFSAYPYQSVEEFLAGGNISHLSDALFKQYDSEYMRALYNATEKHDLVWRSPSLDQAGSGYIVSIFAPVFHQQRLQSYVLADVQLGFIVAMLRDNLPTAMHVKILATNQHLIADSDGTEPSTLRSRHFYPAEFGQASSSVPDPEQIGNDWTLTDQQYQLLLPLSGVPWQAQTVIDAAHIEQLVAADILPLRKAQLFLLVLIAMLWWLLSRYFVTPSLQLAELATREDLTREPRLPRIWQAAKTQLRKLIVERRVALRTLEHERGQLEQQVRDRTRELQNQNTELEAFNFAVSHDLRAPLRAIDGFVSALKEDYSAVLDGTGQRFIDRTRSAVARMEELIEALLALSQLSRVALRPERVNLSELGEEIVHELRQREPARTLVIQIEPEMWVVADRRLIRAALENLLSNAFKYTGKTESARIEFYREPSTAGNGFVIADNGAGFDMKFAERLFTPFQRMHRQDEFTGTGVGLSTVQRIIHRHGGLIRAEAEPGKGARFHFSLP